MSLQCNDMIKTIRKNGNSHSIPLSKDLMEQIGVREGSKVHLQVEGRNIIISPNDDVIPDEVWNAKAKEVMARYDKALRNLA